jgi:tRNA threonylcarbamoyl adenosine modification protein YeaZ
MASDIMNILSIDSSTRRLSIAVSQNERLLSETADYNSMKHMVNIMGLLDRALRRAKLTLKDIDVFGVNIGPGDFTSTRIGISVVKILSWLEEEPAFGINSLDVFTLGISLKNTSFTARCLKKNIPVLVMPCLDVRKGEVYFAFYNLTSGADNIGEYLAEIKTGDRHYYINKAGENFLIRSDKLKSLLNELAEGGVLKIPGCRKEYRNPEILIGGNCYASYSKILSDITRRNKIFRLDKKTVYPRARYLNICAYFNAVRKVKEKNLIPVYVREFVPFGGR